jgi:hypothetical protein
VFLLVVFNFGLSITLCGENTHLSGVQYGKDIQANQAGSHDA